jgi:hypothetical protein
MSTTTSWITLTLKLTPEEASFLHLLLEEHREDLEAVAPVLEASGTGEGRLHDKMRACSFVLTYLERAMKRAAERDGEIRQSST